MQNAWPIVVLSTCRGSCAPQYDCVLGLCTDPSGRPVDPDVIDPETPSEIARYPIYCRMDRLSEPDVTSGNRTQRILRFHNEDASDPTSLCHSRRGSDSMACFSRVIVAKGLRYDGVSDGVLPADILTIAAGGRASLTEYRLRDGSKPALGRNLAVETFGGTCTVRGGD